MKLKSLLLGALCVFSVSAMADDRGRGGPGPRADASLDINLPELNADLRIILGNPHRLDMRDRLERLEAAVADIQRRVYRIERGGHPGRSSFVCSLTVTGGFNRKAYTAKARTRLEAETAVKNACLREQTFEMYCRETIRCEEER